MRPLRVVVLFSGEASGICDGGPETGIYSLSFLFKNDDAKHHNPVQT